MDSFLDSIDEILENGDIPPKVPNRMLLAALRHMDDKIEAQTSACKETFERVGLLERWQSRANGALAAAMFLGGGGLLVTVLKMFGI